MNRDALPLVWIAADWGSSQLRLWALDAEDRLLAQQSLPQGMARLTPAQFEPTLLTALAPWLAAAAGSAPLPLLICGMAGARGGWMEVPYALLPAQPPFGAPQRVPTRHPRLQVSILPGLAQQQPYDVMRGEETQIAGFLAAQPGYSGWLLLPGTHSKWVALEAGRITRFRTFISGELFALLSEQSLLRQLVAPPAGSTGEGAVQTVAFDAGVMQSYQSPAQISAALFSLRAEALLADLNAEAARARLSGLILGLELASMAAECRNQPLALLGAEGLVARYQAALALVEIEAEAYPVAKLTRQGLALAYRHYLAR